MIDLYKIGNRMMIAITPDEELTVSIDKENGTAVIGGSREGYRDLYELLKGEMDRLDPHDHSIRSEGRPRFLGGDV
jgi:hypothetical protein